MLRSLWKANVFNAFGGSAKPVGLRYTRTSLYEPVYLDVRINPSTYNQKKRKTLNKIVQRLFAGAETEIPNLQLFEFPNSRIWFSTVGKLSKVLT